MEMVNQRNLFIVTIIIFIIIIIVTIIVFAEVVVTNVAAVVVAINIVPTIFLNYSTPQAYKCF